MTDWSKLRTFLWGSLFGSAIGLLLAPYRRRVREKPVTVERWEELSGTPCGSQNDGFS